MMSLKCIDKLTGKNKCPDKSPNKIYCDTRTGKCYTSTKTGMPHGFKKQQELARKVGENLIYDEKYKLFGYSSEIDKHKKIIEKSHEKELSPTVLQSLPLYRLKELAKEIDPEWNITSYANQKVLVSAIVRKIGEKKREEQLAEIEREKEEPAYAYDEFDKYDIWTNELNKKTNPRLIEYVPYAVKKFDDRILFDLRTIWK
jgi:hypothetical protein